MVSSERESMIDPVWRQRSRQTSSYRRALQRYLYQEDFSALRGWFTAAWGELNHLDLESSASQLDSNRFDSAEMLLLLHFSQFFLPRRVYLFWREALKRSLLGRSKSADCFSDDHIRFLIEERQFDLASSLVDSGSVRISRRLREALSLLASLDEGRGNKVFQSRDLGNKRMLGSEAQKTVVRLEGPQSEWRASGGAGGYSGLLVGPNIFPNEIAHFEGKWTSYVNDMSLDMRPEVAGAAARSGAHLVFKSWRSVAKATMLFRNPLMFAKSEVISPMDHLLAANPYGPMSLPGILWDLLVRGYRRIEVNGFDFYTSGGADYKDSYGNVPEHQELGNSLRIHEAIGNFLFVKNLESLGVIQADGPLAGALEMSPAAYADFLDDRFPSTLEG